MYGFSSAFTISFPVFPKREIHSFISFYFYTLTEKDGFESRPFLMPIYMFQNRSVFSFAWATNVSTDTPMYCAKPSAT